MNQSNLEKKMSRRAVGWDEHVKRKVESAPVPTEQMVYIRLQRETMWEQNDKVCAYLEAKGEHVRRPDRDLTFVDDETLETSSRPGLSKSQLLPVNFDAKAREMHRHFHYFSTHEHTGTLRTVLVTGGKRCGVQEVRSRYDSLARLVQQGFEDARRRFPKFNVELLFARFEYTAREQDDGTLSYHPHFHCIFSVGNISVTEQETVSIWLQKRLHAENPDEPVESEEALSRYLSKEQGVDLLIAQDELHVLFKQLQRCRFFRTYGPFRKWLAAFRKSGMKVEISTEHNEHGNVVRRYYLRKKKRSTLSLGGVPAKRLRRNDRRAPENVYLAKMPALRLDGTYGVATMFLNAKVDPARIYDFADVKRWSRSAT